MIRITLEGFLGFGEALDERVGLGLVAEQAEGVDLGVGDIFKGLMFLMQNLLGLHEAAIQAHRRFISEKRLGLLARGGHLLVGNNRRAEVIQFFFQGGCGQGRHAGE